MKVLISPVSLEEARFVVEGGADIVDIKNVAEGSLGAQGPWVLRAVVEEFHGRGAVCSAALGDLPFKPGTAALAAFGAANCGVDYIKAGLHGARDYEQALAMMDNVVRAIRLVRSDILAVACGYADCERFGGVQPLDVVRAAAEAKADLAMLDTAIKDGRTLFDALSEETLTDFVQAAREAGLRTALAGSVGTRHLEALARIRPDIVGIRGAVCDAADRTRGITPQAVAAFMAAAHELSPDDDDFLRRRRAG